MRCLRVHRSVLERYVLVGLLRMSGLEIWKAVVGYEGSYEVSNFGRVRSLDRTVVCSGLAKGTYTSRKKGRLLRPGAMPGGHLSVALGQGNSRCVHELVLRAFLGPPPENTEARHLDGNEKNNRFDNLVWDDRGNNNRDKKWHKGCKQYKLKPEEVAEIKRQSVPGNKRSAPYLAEKFNVSESTIYLIRQGKIHVDVRLDH